MKSTSAFLFSFLTLFVVDLSAQNNVGIGTLSPSNKLEVHGNLMVTAPSVGTNTTPTLAQTKSMIQNAPISFLPTDSTGRFFDPGGPGADYLGNSTNSRCSINGDQEGTSILIQIDSIELTAGDSLIIKTNSGGTTLLALGDGYNIPGSHLFNFPTLEIIFKSDDQVEGAGFSILFIRRFPDPNQPAPQNISGNTLYFDTEKGALQSGSSLPVPAVGFNSVGLGYRNQSSGEYSVALGFESKATDEGSVAIGSLNSATEIYSTALGYGSESSGISSMASGYETKAIGDASFASGFFTTASGDHSTAMGIASQATGEKSTAIGWDARATAERSMALGSAARASGIRSTAMGYGSQATGFTATAIGDSTLASGQNSTSMGYLSIANGFTSTSIGFGTVANGHSSLAIGMYNDSLVSPQGNTGALPNTPLFIVGNGDADASRSNAFLVRKDGHVGIGTNTPRTRLHVTNGNAANYSDTSGYFVIGSVSQTNIVFDNNEILARDNGESSNLFLQTTAGKVIIGSSDPPLTNDFKFNVHGNAGKPNGGTWSALSDKRLKECIQPYSDGLNTLLNIRPVRYHYNTMSGYDTKPEYIGVIAQELQEVAPYMVTPAETRLDDGSPGFLTIDNSAMTYMLINAVKELNHENTLLKSETVSLNDQLATIKSEQASMKEKLNALIQQYTTTAQTKIIQK